MAGGGSLRTPVAGIGASAGGVEALEEFFAGLPSSPGLAIVVITHLSPDRESLLHEIIARRTSLTVRIAENDEQVRADVVYVLPPHSILGFKNGRLLLRDNPATGRERKPIDVFLSELATDLGERAAAIILSGGDGDGTLGVKAVKERGGLVMAQTANGGGPAHPEMPNSAIATGFIDFAVPASQMGAKLAEFVRGLSALEDTAEEQHKPFQDAEKSRHAICETLKNQTGHDFKGYKTKTFLRRVQRRMQVAQLDTMDAYVELLLREPEEAHALFRDLLINVTNFFRDAEAFEKLKEVVIPKLFEARGADQTVRIWSPGCATGEEVYSIAMLVREHMDTVKNHPRIQIFATDIDEHALGVARTARYPKALLESVSPERMARFFVRDGASYVVTKDVRDLCIFSPHSVIRDPPFSRIDLISCRNLMIYFGTEIQNLVVPTFYYSLRPGGYLFLGASENVSQFGDLFTPVDKKNRIFRVKNDRLAVARLPLALTALRSAAIPEARPPTARGIAFRRAIEAQVLDRYSPPHIVANRDGEIVFYSTRTGKFLEAAPGVPTRQLFSLTRRSLRLDVRAAFREAVETGRRTTRNGVKFESDDGAEQTMSINVEPLLDPQGAEPTYLVLFQEDGRALSGEDLEKARDVDGLTRQHDAELRDTRERLQSVVEEYETALEELKSSNEELVSVNEEMQSTNEELEASKEELQSLNEELHTVNAELTGKVDQLDAANSDLRNLFENTQVAMVFLDERMNIRMHTPALGRIFNILPTDKGRPLTDLTVKAPMPFLAEDVRATIAGEAPIERRVDRADGSANYLVRIAPYFENDRRPKGSVVTFIDVTSLTQAEQNQKTLIAELNHRVKNMLAMVIALFEQSGKGAASFETFKAGFSDRLHALARSYELLSQVNWRGSPMAEIVKKELALFEQSRTKMTGESIMLSPRQALSLGMILHELATNAAKYGAFSDNSGKVEIEWRRDGAENCVLTWREHDGPPPPQKKGEGFGFKLIEREASAMLGGKPHFEFNDEGFALTLRFRAGG